MVADCPADVVGLPLEGELRRVHPDDHEAVVTVRLVPGRHVRQRPQAVDAGVRPEVDDHDLAAKLLHRQRLRVDPALDRLEIGCDAEVVQPFLLPRPRSADQLLQLSFGAGALLQRLESARVLGNAGLQVLVHPVDHERCDHQDRGAERPSDCGCVRAHRAQVHPAPGRQGDSEQHEAGPEAVGKRDQERPEAEALRGCDRRHGRDHRPCARREEKPEADSEHEAAARVAGLPPGKRVEGTPEQLAEPWPDQGEADDDDDARSPGSGAGRREGRARRGAPPPSA